MLHPKLVLVVGCFGLASNMVGLVLFHDHSHGHSHGDEESAGAAEEGNGHIVAPDDREVADESGSVAAVLPQTRIKTFPSAVT